MPKKLTIDRRTSSASSCLLMPLELRLWQSGRVFKCRLMIGQKQKSCHTVSKVDSVTLQFALIRSRIRKIGTKSVSRFCCTRSFERLRGGGKAPQRHGSRENSLFVRDCQKSVISLLAWSLTIQPWLAVMMRTKQRVYDSHGYEHKMQRNGLGWVLGNEDKIGPRWLILTASLIRASQKVTINN